MNQQHDTPDTDATIGAVLTGLTRDLRLRQRAAAARNGPAAQDTRELGGKRG